MLLLMLEFFKVGLFAIGGGLATLPFLYELAEKYPWFTKAELTDMIAVSESTPGPIGINMSTYAGFNAGGLIGGALATLSLVAPSIIVIIIIARFLEKFSDNKYVNTAFGGIRPAVTGLIAAAGFGVIELCLFKSGFQLNRIWEFINIPNTILFGIILYLVIKFNKHPVFYIAGAAIVGLIFKL